MNVLAVGCHPDDLEIGCGGTLAKYAEQGHDVFMCHIANGDKGHAIIMPEKLRVIRIKEALRGGEKLGASKVFNLDVADLLVKKSNEDTVLKMIEVIRFVKPDIIITHDPNDYMEDHRQTSQIVFDASFSASVPHYETSSEAFKIAPLYYMDTIAGIEFNPEHYVDISPYIEIKLDALNMHESQIKWMLDHDKIDFLDFVRTISKFRGLQCNAAYAEGFKQCKVWPRGTTKRLLP
jgi:LmbE family N-acetylglucosaminyl deacetylase